MALLTVGHGPQGREALGARLVGAVVWDERLGGPRRLVPGEPVEDGWWTVAQFAAYAAHTRTAVVSAALARWPATNVDQVP